LREIRRDGGYRVGDYFGVPVLPLERCPAGGAGGSLAADGLGENIGGEQGDGVASADGPLAAVRAAGICCDVATDQ
jgi:hypothetical protein